MKKSKNIDGPSKENDSQTIVLKRKFAWPWFLLVIILLIFIMFGFASCMGMVQNASNSLGISTASDTNYDGDAIALITMDGSISYDGTVCSPKGLSAKLAKAEKDDSIKGVILRINSGGGTATAGEEMSEYVKNFNKPIVVSCAATCASAAYEIASQSDYIFAAKSSAVGSIGAAIQITDLSGLYEMLGINVENITSSDSKDATYSTRALTDAERQWYQDMIDQIGDEFIRTVAEGRNLPFDDVKKLANGLSYTGVDAVSNGLIDEIGTLEDALLYISNLAGYDKSLSLVDYNSSTKNLISLMDPRVEKDNEEGSQSALNIKEQYAIR